MNKLFDFRNHYQRVKGLYLRYERLLMPSTLVSGFLVDYFTFTSVKIAITFTLLSVYWIAAGATIAFIQLYDSEKISKKLNYVRLLAPLLIQFTFGALLGSTLVFYWFSGSLSISWPFIAITALLLFSNDIFRKYFSKVAVQISVYFFITLSFFALILPFLFNSISPWIFIISGIFSIAVLYGYVKLLSAISNAVKQQKKFIIILVITIFFAMNSLYFFNIIPPIPLSIREAGIYNQIKRSDGSYILVGEPETLLQKIIPGQALRLESGERAYAYTAVFAPAELNIDIVHHWQHYDEKEKKWLTMAKPSFSIIGGRKEGYKGYSWISNAIPGKWRVYVETPRGQVLGRIMASIERTEQQPKFQETIK